MKQHTQKFICHIFHLAVHFTFINNILLSNIFTKQPQNHKDLWFQLHRKTASTFFGNFEVRIFDLQKNRLRIDSWAPLALHSNGGATFLSQPIRWRATPGKGEPGTQRLSVVCIYYINTNYKYIFQFYFILILIKFLIFQNIYFFIILINFIYTNTTQKNQYNTKYIYIYFLKKKSLYISFIKLYKHKLF